VTNYPRPVPERGLDVLVVDTATADVTAAVVRLGATSAELLATRVATGARRHGELLTPLVADAVADAGIALRDLDAVVAGTGPGPYTGLRVGLVTAVSLADALGVRAYGVCTLDGLATDDGVTLVATDARRREVYWAVYSGGRRIAGPAVDRPADVDAQGATTARGAGARLYDLGLPASGPDAPDPVRMVLQVAADIRAGTPGGPLTPLYLRRPDAVEPAAAKTVSQA
jgi:tRNA threonylcarbamoyl adenosine modification protein YeaZ